MVGTAALSGVAKDLDLAISDDALVEMILQDPAFAGLSGQFDEPTFRMVLRRNGLNEDLFVNDQRDFHVREQLMAATFDRAMVPEIMQSQLFAHFLERRTAKYAILSLGATEEVGEPTEEELEAFYKRHAIALHRARTPLGGCAVSDPRTVCREHHLYAGRFARGI